MSPLVDTALKPSGKKLSQLKNELRSMNQDPSYYPRGLLEWVARQTTRDLLNNLRNMVMIAWLTPSPFSFFFFFSYVPLGLYPPCFRSEYYIWMAEGSECIEKKKRN